MSNIKDKSEFIKVDEDNLIIDDKRRVCVCCSKIKPVTQFFSIKSDFVNSNSFNICKDCINTIKKDGNMDDILKLFRFIDKPMYEERWNKNLSKCEGKDFLAIVGKYFASTAMLGDRRYDDGDLVTTNKKFLLGTTEVSIENEIINDNDDDTCLEKEQLKAKNDVIKILDYDPFDGYNITDQKFLYPELVRYLDEDTAEDAFKVSVVIQIITNSLQIRWCDIAINKLGSNTDSFIKNSSVIKELGATKSQLNQNNDKLSKENQIATKHRGDSSSKNSTLGSMMKSLREMNFDKAEMDYYTIQKSYGMKQSMDISNQSILDIIKFDENKQNEVFKGMREMIVKFQEDELDFNEKIRLLIVENNKLKRELINK